MEVIRQMKSGSFISNDLKLAKKIDKLIANEYLKEGYNDGTGYNTEDLSDIIILLIENHAFTSRTSINNLIERLEELKEDY